jgi:propionate CoA-transferase
LFEKHVAAGITAFAAGIGYEFGECRRVADTEVQALRADRRQYVGGLAHERHAAGGEAFRGLSSEREDPARAVDFHLAEDRVGAALDFKAELTVIEGVQPYGLIGLDDPNEARAIALERHQGERPALGVEFGRSIAMRSAVPEIQRDRRLRQGARAHLDAGGGATARFPAVGGGDQPHAFIAVILLQRRAVRVEFQRRDRRLGDAKIFRPAAGREQPRSQMGIFDIVAEGFKTELRAVEHDFRRAQDSLRRIHQAQMPERRGFRRERRPNAERVEHLHRAVEQRRRPPVGGRRRRDQKRLGAGRRERKRCHEAGGPAADHRDFRAECFRHERGDSANNHARRGWYRHARRCDKVMVYFASAIAPPRVLLWTERTPVALKKVISADDAIALIQDGDVVASCGYGGNGNPEALLAAIERRFLAGNGPRGLTLVWAGGQGDGKDRGLNRLGYETLLKRTIGGHYGLIPRIEALAVANKIEAYNLPEGVITHLYRDIAAGKPGMVTKVGVGTFVDPRFEGGKINESAKQDLVQVISLLGEDYLFFHAFPIHVALIRGTTADPEGNVTMERESLRLETLAMALAARNSGGVVLCQVERIAQSGSLDARRVRVPGILVDAVVEAAPDEHMQNYGTHYNAALSGEVRVPMERLKALPLDTTKVIARRTTMELSPNSVVNLGLGLPNAVSAVVAEERIEDLITLTVDPGVFGGVPLGGLDFGASVNFTAAIDHPYQFDFIDGGGLDVACLGYAECDARGNVNVSRFAKRVPGCGGFINISQRSRKVVFLGTFTSGGLEARVENGTIGIKKEGKHRKFVNEVGQVTFSSTEAAKREQEVLYVTERCVFRLHPNGLELVEVAPGIDVKKDILDLLPFEPNTSNIQLMDARIFAAPPLLLRDHLLDLRIEDRLSYDPTSNTVFMNYSGMRVRTEADLDRIKSSVDGLLGPLNKRVYSIVNYDRFEADPDIMHAYLDLVRYVEEKYYIAVSRYTNSGFMRLKLGSELGKRKVSSHVFERAAEARDSLKRFGRSE